jgi:hypothetical protein
MSSMLTTLTSSSLENVLGQAMILPRESAHSLATATHLSSGDIARSLTDNEHRTRRRSNAFVSSEYSETEPSSAPTIKLSFWVDASGVYLFRALVPLSLP